MADMKNTKTYIANWPIDNIDGKVIAVGKSVDLDPNADQTKELLASGALSEKSAKE